MLSVIGVYPFWILRVCVSLLTMDVCAHIGSKVSVCPMESQCLLPQWFCRVCVPVGGF